MSRPEITNKTGELTVLEPEYQKPALRDGRGRWLPGQCPNPGGRPKLAENVRELAKEYSETAVETLVDICLNSKSDSAKVQAATALLDRGYGRPSQEIYLDDNRENDFVVKIEGFNPAWTAPKNEK